MRDSSIVSIGASGASMRRADRIRLSVSDSPRKYVDHTNSIIDDLIAERE